MPTYVYILIGFVAACLIGWLVIMAFAYGLGGKSPAWIRPLQLLLFGNMYEKLRVLFWLAVIALAYWVGRYHLQII